jgi:alpha 1,3-glucosidase
MAEVKICVNQLLTLSISGLHFVGADIPGFHGKPSEETYILFYQLGAFFPFMRAHGHVEALRREPFRQLRLVQETTREAVFLRYSFIHYL